MDEEHFYIKYGAAIVLNKYNKLLKTDITKEMLINIINDELKYFYLINKYSPENLNDGDKIHFSFIDMNDSTNINLKRITSPHIITKNLQKTS